MANIALFVPFEDMLEKAERVIEKNHFQVSLVKQIETYSAVEEARRAAEAGIGIIVARGRQARLIKAYTNIPLVEIRFSPQEIGLMIQKARKLTKMENPHIGLIVYNNMLCDLSFMEELFQVRLSVCLIEEAIEAPAQAAKLKEDGVNLIIGGESVCNAAEEVGIPALLYESMELSIQEALRTAERMAFAQESDKQNSAQFSAIMDTTVSGIIKINLDGSILLLNRRMESLLGKRQSEVVGNPVCSVIPQIEADAVKSILNGTRESYASTLNIQNSPWVLVISPIQYDNRVSGAILAFHAAGAGQLKPRSNVLSGFSASCTFSQIHTENREMKETLSLAKTYAISDRPILLAAPEGVETQMLAEAIHNNSARKSGPFVTVYVDGLDAQQQNDTILGVRSEENRNKEKERLHGALVRAHNGTLLLVGAEHLSPFVQHEMYRFLRSEEAGKTETPDIGLPDVRLIAVTRTPLHQALSQGRFNPALYYCLQGLTLTIPPLHSRPEDLEARFRSFVQVYSRKYSRYFKLTDGACKKVLSYSWEGNLLQLEAFTERLVLTTQKRMIDEAEIDRLYRSLYPVTREMNGAEQVVVYQAPEAARLQALMEQYHGNRSQIAKELGISTTTLWRRLKKYGLE